MLSSKPHMAPHIHRAQILKHISLLHTHRLQLKKKIFGFPFKRNKHAGNVFVREETCKECLESR